MTIARYRAFRRTIRATVGIAFITTFSAQCGSDVAKPDGLRMTTIAGHSTAELGDTNAATAIVMLHGRSTHKDSWYPMMPKLVAAGYRAVAYDYDSSGDPDIVAVIEQLRGERVGSFVLMGSSLGAGHVLRASNDCEIAAYATITFSAGEVVDVPGQPILAIASNDDGTTAATARAISDNRGLSSRAEIIEGSTHGVDLVNDHPETIDAVVEWLKSLPRTRSGPGQQSNCRT